MRAKRANGSLGVLIGHVLLLPKLREHPSSSAVWVVWVAHTGGCALVPLLVLLVLVLLVLLLVRVLFVLLLVVLAVLLPLPLLLLLPLLLPLWILNAVRGVGVELCFGVVPNRRRDQRGRMSLRVGLVLNFGFVILCVNCGGPRVMRS